MSEITNTALPQRTREERRPGRHRADEFKAEVPLQPGEVVVPFRGRHRALQPSETTAPAPGRHRAVPPGGEQAPVIPLQPARHAAASSQAE